MMDDMFGLQNLRLATQVYLRDLCVFAAFEFEIEEVEDD